MSKKKKKRKGKSSSSLLTLLPGLAAVVKTAPLSAQHKCVTLAHKGYPVLELDSEPHAATPIQPTCLGAGASDRRRFQTCNRTTLFTCYNFSFGRTKDNGATSHFFSVKVSRSAAKIKTRASLTWLTPTLSLNLSLCVVLSPSRLLN